MNWEELSEKIDKKINIGTEIPKAENGHRPVTRKKGVRIYMRTGVKTNSEKFITNEMIRYAYETIQSGKIFISKGLRLKFPKEYSQGGCVFSMAGGILVFFKIAKYIPHIGYKQD